MSSESAQLVAFGIGVIMLGILWPKSKVAHPDPVKEQIHQLAFWSMPSRSGISWTSVEPLLMDLGVTKKQFGVVCAIGLIQMFSYSAAIGVGCARIPKFMNAASLMFFKHYVIFIFMIIAVLFLIEFYAIYTVNKIVITKFYNNANKP